MTITSSSDISVVLSGGTGNTSPNLSIGGHPSPAPVISNSLNNLFDDILPEESEDGHEDYRCIYFFNDGDTEIYEPKIWITDDLEAGATMEIGIEDHTESQRITLSDALPTGGTITLSYDGVQFVTTYNANFGLWATNLQTTLRALDVDDRTPLEEVTVTAQLVSSTTLIFDVNFIGNAAKRSHPNLIVVQDNLTPSGVIIAVTTPQEGAPINTVAAEIDVETTPPGGVGFFAASSQSPITLPILYPGDGFPLWIKRVVTENTGPKENDGVSIRFRAETLRPE